jgi:hypothetical protein
MTNGINGSGKDAAKEAVERDLIEQASKKQDELFNLFGNDAEGMAAVNQTDLAALVEILESKGIITRIEWLTRVYERRRQLLESLKETEIPT